MKKRYMAAWGAVGFAMAIVVNGCATIGPCTHWAVQSERRQAVASGRMTALEAQSRIGLESVPLWKSALATVGDTGIWGTLGYGAYRVVKAIGGGSSDADINVTAADSSRVVVAVDGSRIDSSLNSSSFNSSKSSSSSRSSSVTN